MRNLDGAWAAAATDPSGPIPDGQQECVQLPSRKRSPTRWSMYTQLDVVPVVQVIVFS